jgi:hypothetical protein
MPPEVLAEAEIHLRLREFFKILDEYLRTLFSLPWPFRLPWPTCASARHR